MLRLSEIRRLKDSVDAEWRSPIADDVAAAWGIPPGIARWWRSSATHVLVVPGAPRRYLRFVTADSDAAIRLRRGAELSSAFPDVEGLVVARPLPSSSGARVPTVETAFGTLAAVLVEEAPGEALDAASISAEHAHRWGAGLARFHAHAPAVARGSGPLDSHRRVTMHGDFELDNLRFIDGGIAVFDFDEARPGWAAEDIALATRALRGDEGDADRPELYATFLAGYRSVAQLSAAEEAAVHAHSLRYSAIRAADESMLDEGGHPDDPAWQRELHDELRAAIAWHRRAVEAGSR